MSLYCKNVKSSAKAHNKLQITPVEVSEAGGGVKGMLTGTGTTSGSGVTSGSGSVSGSSAMLNHVKALCHSLNLAPVN